MEMGTASYPRGRDLGSEAQRAHDARQATDPVAASLAAVRRDNVPTLAEAMAAVDMVTGPDGAMMPRKLAARGDRGFGGADENRDSTDAERLTALVREMDVMCAHVIAAHIPGAALKLAEQWTKIRDITQANTDRPNREEV